MPSLSFTSRMATSRSAVATASRAAAADGTGADDHGADGSQRVGVGDGHDAVILRDENAEVFQRQAQCVVMCPDAPWDLTQAGSQRDSPGRKVQTVFVNVISVLAHLHRPNSVPMSSSMSLYFCGPRQPQPWNR